MHRIAAIAVALLALGACSDPQPEISPTPTAAPAVAAPTVSSEPAAAAPAAAGEVAAVPAAPVVPEGGLIAPVGGGPIVELYTSKGVIVLQLDAEKAPVSTKNFIEYVRSGHYDGTIFHRVIPGFMIQGGGMTPALDEKPTRDPIVNEGNNGLKNLRGTIAMARTNDLNSATSQFFINVKDNAMLDYPSNGGYAVFGKVISGMEVADAIVSVPRGSRGMHDDVPNETIPIQKAKMRE